MPDNMTHPKPSSALLIAAAWIVVILPAAWGLNFTVQNALKLFTAAPAATAPAPAAPAAAAPAAATPQPAR